MRSLFRYLQGWQTVMFSLFLALWCLPAILLAQDRLLDLLADELNRELTVLQAQELRSGPCCGRKPTESIARRRSASPK